MIAFAMRSASARYEARMNAALERLGPTPRPRELVTGILTALLPVDDQQQQDARIALAFQSYAATRPAAADGLRADNVQLCGFLAEQLSSASGVSVTEDHEHAATALLGMAEGLGLQVVSTGLPVERALAALRAQIDLTLTALAP